MDPVSDTLRAVRLTGAYFYLVEAAAPWAVASVPARGAIHRVDRTYLMSLAAVKTAL